MNLLNSYDKDHLCSIIVKQELKIDELNKTISSLESDKKTLIEELDSLTLVVGLTPIAGNKEALQEAFNQARATITKMRGITRPRHLSIRNTT
jgi:hypothetical protein